MAARPLLDAARHGYARLFWSPLIIAEANRLLTWLWLERHGGDLSDASWRRCSADAKAMFARLRPAFHVVDDRPPDAELWTATPPDEWDVPIWTAALRAEADVIVSANLEDGPPEDERGVREFEGIDFVHPDQCVEILAYFAERIEAEGFPALEDNGGEASHANPYRRLYSDLWERVSLESGERDD